MLHAIIMAGGTGTRFWPRSTKAHPKQFLNIFGEHTMLQTTAYRIRQRVPVEQLWVITNERYVELVKEQLPALPDNNIVGEPVAKNTAPCVALAAALIANDDPDATMVVLPADHQISQIKKFLSILDTAVAKAKTGDPLVTIGIKPDRPETGYGYIEYDENTSEVYEGMEVKKVRQFREKPNLETAKKFLASGNFLWNSGMFVWQTSTILKQFEKQLPKIQKGIQKLSSKIGKENQKKSIDEFYHNCPSVSIDYGIMEQADSVYVVPGSFGWNDVGSWSAVYDLRNKDESGNVIISDTVTLASSKNNYIQSESGKMIALVGIDNVAVVETDNAILICNLDEAQEVKEVVNQLEKNEEKEKFL